MRPGRLFLFSCAIAAGIPFLVSHSGGHVEFMSGAFPTTWEGHALKPIPLSSAEKAFSKGFPGNIGRFTDGRREILFRRVGRETRSLHSSMDCVKAGGYTVTPMPLLVDGEGRSWAQFKAEKSSDKMLVREIVIGNNGESWTDVSAWYWAAVLGKSTGPWTAVTVSEAL